MGLKLLPPDINESDDGFTPIDDAVRFGLNAIKGIGSSSVHAIMEARKSGPFTSLFDFATRVDQGSVNRRALESLITAGAFDSLIPPDESVNLGGRVILPRSNRHWPRETRPGTIKCAGRTTFLAVRI